MQDTSIKALVLCERKFGTHSFNQKNVDRIYSDIEFLKRISGDDPDEIVIIDYLTTGFNQPDDVMTFNFQFDYRNRQTQEFVRDHIKHYSYIVIGECPFYIFNDNNVELLSQILKDNGKIIISPSDNKAFKSWIDQTKFLSKFTKIMDEPKIVLEKQDRQSKRRKINPKEIIVIDDDEDEKQQSLMFKSKKAYKVDSKDKKISEVFEEIETGGGGSCLFYSLAYETTGKNSLKEARKLRQMICKYKPEDLEPFVALASSEKSMCDDKSYGTTIEIHKAARLLNRPIIVFKEKRKQGIASEDVCPGAHLIDMIKNSKMFKGVYKYLFKPYDKVQKNIYCLFLPEHDTDAEPILLYNIGDYHYRLLKPKKISKVSRKSRKSRKVSRKSSRKSRKSSRKSRKSRKSSRKSRKSSRKSRRSSRKSRRSSRKSSRKSRRSSKKSSRKSKNRNK